jgi:hypothetical protein
VAHQDETGLEPTIKTTETSPEKSLARFDGFDGALCPLAISRRRPDFFQSDAEMRFSDGAVFEPVPSSARVSKVATQARLMTGR